MNEIDWLDAIRKAIAAAEREYANWRPDPTPEEVELWLADVASRIRS